MMHTKMRIAVFNIGIGNLIICSLLLLTAPLFAADAPPNPDTVEMWKTLRTSLFGDRPIVNDDGKVVSLNAPSRAEDASTVPVQIKTNVEQSATRYIQKLYLFIDKNPSPVAAIFTFTPESGRADIDTRVRVEDYSHMRAVAEMNDGKLYMATHYIKASGGCSAATGTLPDHAGFQPKAKFKIDPNVEAGQATVAQLMIHHPNSSGLARDQVTNLYQPAYYVRTIKVSYAGQEIMTAEVDFSISENPNFRFYFKPNAAGELKAEIVDTRDLKVESVIKIVPSGG